MVEANAIITKATITIERGFLLSSWVYLDYGGSGQGLGGFVLGGTPDSKAGDHTAANFAAEWIVGVMRAADVEDWSSLPGRAVRVRRDREGLSGTVVGIGHIIRDDRWFSPESAFARLGASEVANG